MVAGADWKALSFRPSTTPTQYSHTSSSPHCLIITQQWKSSFLYKQGPAALSFVQANAYDNSYRKRAAFIITFFIFLSIPLGHTLSLNTLNISGTTIRKGGKNHSCSRVEPEAAADRRSDYTRGWGNSPQADATRVKPVATLPTPGREDNALCSSRVCTH